MTWEQISPTQWIGTDGEGNTVSVSIREGLDPAPILAAHENGLPPDVPDLIIPYVVFENRWTEGELAALHAAKVSNWQVERLYTRAVVQGHVNLSGEMAAAAKALFVDLEVLSVERADEIFSTTHEGA